MSRGNRPPDISSDYSIDYDHWLKLDVWKIGSAASILENSDPFKLKDRLEVDVVFHERFFKKLNIIIAAEGRTLEVESRTIYSRSEKILEYGLVKPVIFTRWAITKGYAIPPPFMVLTDNKQDNLIAPKTAPNVPPFSNPPKTKDDWFKIIESVMYQYKNEHGQYPESSQVWSILWDRPPKTYPVTQGKDSYKELALCWAGTTLTKNGMYRRFRRWTGKDK